MTNNISDSTYAKGYLIQYNFKFDSAKINKGDKFTFTVKNTDTSKTLPGIETSNVAVYVASSGDAFAISSTDDNNGTTTITLTANQPQDYYDGLLNPEVKVMMQTTGNTDNTGYIKQQKEKTQTYDVKVSYNGSQLSTTDPSSFKIFNLINPNGPYNAFNQEIFMNKGGLPYPDYSTNGTPYNDNGFASLVKTANDTDYYPSPSSYSNNYMYLYSQNAMPAWAQILFGGVTNMTDSDYNANLKNYYSKLTWTIKLSGDEAGTFDLSKAPDVYEASDGTFSHAKGWTYDKTASEGDSSHKTLIFTFDPSQLSSSDHINGINFDVSLPIKTTKASDQVNVISSLTGDKSSKSSTVTDKNFLDAMKIPIDSENSNQPTYRAHLVYSNPLATIFAPALFENTNAVSVNTGDSDSSTDLKNLFNSGYFKLESTDKESKTNETDFFKNLLQTDLPVPSDMTKANALMRNPDLPADTPNNETLVRDCRDYNNGGQGASVLNYSNLYMHYANGGVFKKVVESDSAKDANGNPEPKLDEAGNPQVITGDGNSFDVTKSFDDQTVNPGLYVGYIYATNDVDDSGKLVSSKSQVKMVKFYVKNKNTPVTKYYGSLTGKVINTNTKQQLGTDYKLGTGSSDQPSLKMSATDSWITDRAATDKYDVKGWTEGQEPSFDKFSSLPTTIDYPTGTTEPVAGQTVYIYVTPNSTPTTDKPINVNIRDYTNKDALLKNFSYSKKDSDTVTVNLNDDILKDYVSQDDTINGRHLDKAADDIKDL
ncbi:hypothetical protein KOM07_00840 [Lentilactobacillus sp. G22-6]|uniref:hypothetical protein n=1 Tax=Lentilactobacillus dabitei TaxID=2831523 RepID=UPI001C27C781|nr:hypothetical protein [Lentilactobacillus dabitei]MBU9788111.1 hypothetical protein [Lentilactobacillus dabitei]